MVDHDAVAFVKELLCEDHCPGISSEYGGAGWGAEVGAFVNAGELAVEGAAGAEAVRGGGFDGGLKVAGPKGILGAVICGCREGCFLGFGGGFDEFLIFRAGLNKSWFDGDGAGAVVGGADWDLYRQVAWFFLGICGDFEAGCAGRGFDVDTGEGKPGIGFRSLKELDLVAEPFAFDFCEWVTGVDADEFWRAGFDDGWSEGDGLGVQEDGKRE